MFVAKILTGFILTQNLIFFFLIQFIWCFWFIVKNIYIYVNFVLYSLYTMMSRFIDNILYSIDCAFFRIRTLKTKTYNKYIYTHIFIFCMDFTQQYSLIIRQNMVRTTHVHQYYLSKAPCNNIFQKTYVLFNTALFLIITNKIIINM